MFVCFLLVIQMMVKYRRLFGNKILAGNKKMMSRGVTGLTQWKLYKLEDEKCSASLDYPVLQILCFVREAIHFLHAHARAHASVRISGHHLGGFCKKKNSTAFTEKTGRNGSSFSKHIFTSTKKPFIFRLLDKTH